MSSDRWTWILTGATVAGVSALYVGCAPRAVPGGDSGIQQSVMCLCLYHMQPITEQHTVISYTLYVMKLCKYELRETY